MRKRSNKEKIIEDVLNIDLLNLKFLKLKPTIPVSIVSRSNNRLKEKVTSLVQLQLKNNQINQNFLNPLKPTNFTNEVLKKNRITIYINTKYDIVATVSSQIGYKIVNENEDWNLMWIDGSICSLKAFSIQRHQRVNHFPGMQEISRKDKLQRNLKVMQRYFNSDYDVFPKTWSLPAEKAEILTFLRDKQSGHHETFIIKPACSSQGRGIILINDINSLSVNGNTICQVYIANPFLIDGYKFDLRLYVLITSCDPLRIFVYEEGLARFATNLYEKPNTKNLDNVFMHLTNYSVQRNSEKFNKDELNGTKRRASTIYEWFNKNGYDANAIWKSVDDVLIKTMLCANNSIKHSYSATFPDKYRTSACFELLGFDIILDENLKPFVLEVNHSPSLETETNLDLTIKSKLLTDIFSLVNSVPINLRKMTELERMRSAERLYWSRNKYMSSRKAAFEFRNVLTEIQTELEKCEMDNKNGFRLLYPIIGQTEKYQKYFEFNCENHRRNINKYTNFDEPEQRIINDISKDSYPTKFKKSFGVNIFCRNRLINHDSRIRLRSINHKINSGLKNIDGNLKNDVKIPNKLKNIATNEKNEKNISIEMGGLLNTSKKSLHKIILSNKHTKLPKIVDERNSDSNSQESFQRIDTTSSSIDSNIDVSSINYSLRNMKTIKNKRATKFLALILKEEHCDFINLKSSHLSYNIELTSSDIIDFESEILSISREHDINTHEITTRICPLAEQDINSLNLLSIVKSMENVNSTIVRSEDVNDSEVSYNSEERIIQSLLNGSVCLQISTRYPHYLPSIKTQPDLVMHTILTEKESDSIYSTGLSVSSVDVIHPKYEINCNNHHFLNSTIISQFSKNCNEHIFQQKSYKNDISKQLYFSETFKNEGFQWQLDIFDCTAILKIKIHHITSKKVFNFQKFTNKIYSMGITYACEMVLEDRRSDGSLQCIKKNKCISRVKVSVTREKDDICKTKSKLKVRISSLTYQSNLLHCMIKSDSLKEFNKNTSICNNRGNDCCNSIIKIGKDTSKCLEKRHQPISQKKKKIFKEKGMNMRSQRYKDDGLNLFGNKEIYYDKLNENKIAYNEPIKEAKLLLPKISLEKEHRMIKYKPSKLSRRKNRKSVIRNAKVSHKLLSSVDREFSFSISNSRREKEGVHYAEVTNYSIFKEKEQEQDTDFTDHTVRFFDSKAEENFNIDFNNIFTNNIIEKYTPAIMLHTESNNFDNVNICQVNNINHPLNLCQNNTSVNLYSSLQLNNGNIYHHSKKVSRKPLLPMDKPTESQNQVSGLNYSKEALTTISSHIRGGNNLSNKEKNVIDHKSIIPKKSSRSKIFNDNAVQIMQDFSRRKHKNKIFNVSNLRQRQEVENRKVEAFERENSLFPIIDHCGSQMTNNDLVIVDRSLISQFLRKIYIAKTKQNELAALYEFSNAVKMCKFSPNILFSRQDRLPVSLLTHRRKSR